MDVSKIIDQLTPIFNSLAEKVGQGGQWMFELYVRQQYVVAIQDLGWSILAFSICGFSLWGTIKILKTNDDAIGFAVFLGIVSIIFLVWGGASVFSMAGHLINPQYYALQDLVGTFIPQPSK